MNLRTIIAIAPPCHAGTVTLLVDGEGTEKPTEADMKFIEQMIAQMYAGNYDRGPEYGSYKAGFIEIQQKWRRKLAQGRLF